MSKREGNIQNVSKSKFLKFLSVKVKHDTGIEIYNVYDEKIGNSKSTLNPSRDKKLFPHWEIILTTIIGFLTFLIGYSVTKYLSEDVKVLAMISLLGTVIVTVISVTTNTKEKSLLKRCAINLLVFIVVLGGGMFVGSMGRKESQKITTSEIPLNIDKEVISEHLRKSIPTVSKADEEITPKAEKEKDKSGEKEETPELSETKEKIATITLTEKDRSTSTKTGTFSLTIFSEPSAAEIYLDGEFKGRTPKTIKPIPLGEHIIELKAEGYKDWKDMVTIKESVFKRVITVDLEQNK